MNREAGILLIGIGLAAIAARRGSATMASAKMKISEAGIAFIKQHEGLRLEAYRDPVGVWTIGYGHTRGVRPGMKITREEADRLLREDLRRFEECVNRLVAVPLSQPMFDALVSFAFNLGCGALQRSTLLRLLNSGNYRAAAKEFTRWVYAGGKILPGLVKRRAAEREMFLSGLDLLE